MQRNDCCNLLCPVPLVTKTNIDNCLAQHSTHTMNFCPVVLISFLRAWSNGAGRLFFGGIYFSSLVHPGAGCCKLPTPWKKLLCPSLVMLDCGYWERNTTVVETVRRIAMEKGSDSSVLNLVKQDGCVSDEDRRLDEEHNRDKSRKWHVATWWELLSFIFWVVVLLGCYDG